MAGRNTMSRRLKPHVRACRDGDWVIFLDLRGNAYSALNGAGVDLIASRGINAPEDKLAQLERRGLVAQAAPCRSAHLLPAWIRFLAACVWARRVVARGELERAASELSALKWRCDGDGNTNPDLSRYVRLRPWFPGAHACLFDSLALSRFLMGAGNAVDWVVGVKARPFAAHSWVECDGAILNDDAEACASFVEILRV